MGRTARIRRLGIVWLIGLASLCPASAGAQSPLQAPAPVPTPLTLRAVDDQGRPLAGAELALWPLESSYEEGRRRLSGAALEPVARGVADARGLVRLEAPAPALYRVGDDAFLVHVYDELRAVQPWEPATPSSLPVPAETAVEQLVQVLDARDEPVSEALVRVGTPAVPAGLTDAEGRLVIRIPAAAEELRLVAETEDRRTDVVVSPSDTTLVLHLADPVEVSGFVRDARSREPLGGALVWIGGRDAETPWAVAYTDSQGRYALRRPSSPETGRLRVAVPGYVESSTGWNAGSPAPTLVPEPAATVFGRVVDPEKEAVAGVQITLGDRRATPTDAEGRFRLGGLRPGATPSLVAEAPGFAPTAVDLPKLTPGSAHGEIHVVLEPGIRGFGYVFDAEEEPVENARVTLIPAGRDAASPWRVGAVPTPGLREPLATTTDSTGRFEILDVSAGRYRITVQADGFAPTAVPGVEVAGDADSVDLGSIYLDPGVRLEGRVVDPTGSPVEGATVGPDLEGSFLAGVLSGPWAADPEAQILTDVEGRFEIADLPPGQRLGLWVTRDGYVRRHVEGLRAPAEEPVEIVLQPGGRLEGVVTDANGNPLADSSVQVGRVMRTPTGPSVILPDSPSGYVSTGEDGRFQVTELPPGEVFLRAEKRGFLPSEIRRLEIEPGIPSEEIRVVLERGATITGRVFDPEGVPVPRASVRWVDHPSGGGSALTDGDGRYRLEGIPSGSGTLEARHEDYPRVLRDVELEFGSYVEDFRLRRGRSLGGRVVDENGALVTGATVILQADTAYEHEETGADGTFRFEGLEPGSYRLRAEAPGRSATELPQPIRVADVDVTGVEIRLSPGVDIRGRVVGLEQDDLARTQVAAVRADEAVQRVAEPSWDGTFVLDDVGPGSWRVLAMVDEKGMVVEEVEVGEAGADVELVFGDGLVVTGRVLRNGKPLVGAIVGLQGRDSTSLGMTTTDASGAYRLEGLEPGPHLMRVAYEFRQVYEEDVDLSGDREILVELSGASLSGRVIDAETGVPLSEAAVELRGIDDGGASSFGGKLTDAGGGFRFDDVGDGTYRVVASRSDYGTESVTVSVESAAAAEPVEIALEPAGRVHLIVRVVGAGSPGQVHVAALDDSGVPGFQGTLTAGEGGRVRLDGLPEGSWDLWIAAPGTASTVAPVRSPGPDVPVSLSLEASLDVSLPSQAGSLGESGVRLLGPGGAAYRSVDRGGGLRSRWTVLGARGRLDGLAPGAWTVEATLPDGRALSAPVRLRSGTLTSVTLE